MRHTTDQWSENKRLECSALNGIYIYIMHLSSHSSEIFEEEEVEKSIRASDSKQIQCPLK